MKSDPAMEISCEKLLSLPLLSPIFFLSTLTHECHLDKLDSQGSLCKETNLKQEVSIPVFQLKSQGENKKKVTIDIYFVKQQMESQRCSPERTWVESKHKSNLFFNKLSFDSKTNKQNVDDGNCKTQVVKIISYKWLLHRRLNWRENWNVWMYRF